jgi:hypothetical protein
MIGQSVDAFERQSACPQVSVGGQTPEAVDHGELPRSNKDEPIPAATMAPADDIATTTMSLAAPSIVL